MNTTNKLTSHIITTVYEGILKLGNTGNESYSIFYDLDLLNYLLDANYTSKEECLSYLESIYSNEYSNADGLIIKVQLEKGRFKFTVPASSMDAIRSYGSKNSFLAEIITLVGSHHFTIDDVKQVFSHYSADYVCETTNHPEFQYVLYFKDNEINHYKYCFTFDGCGGYYHRLLDYDYQKILEEEM